jgi:trans-aconitate 2-methyltransferase
MTATTDWNAAQYLKFEDERTRPSADLLARVPLQRIRSGVDLGCGPGNSTELLIQRYGAAGIVGMDSSAGMLEKARARLPGTGFIQADIAGWTPPGRFDLVFANAVLQWLPDHERLLPGLVRLLEPGGCLAVQMPDNLDEPSHVAMREVAARGAWATALRRAGEAKAEIGSIEDYYRWLRQAGCTVDIWRTTYVHALKGAGEIVEWFKSTGLKPYIDPLEPSQRAEFLALYDNEMRRSYPAQADGTVLLRFPRLFIVAQRTG